MENSLISRRLDDNAEVGVGEPASLDALEEPPERRGVRHVGGRGLTRTTGKHATDTATDVGND